MSTSRAWYVGLGATIVILAMPHISTMQSPLASGAARVDPAVDAYTTFIQGKKLTVPVDRTFVVAALDRLVSAVEGLALARDASTEGILKAAHRLRRDIRRLARANADTPPVMKAKTDVFTEIAKLMVTVDQTVNPKPAAERSVLDALSRSADGLDFDYPLRWQPNNIEQFLQLAAEGLQRIAGS